MANYPMYNFNPQTMGYQPQMQPMYQPYQPQQQQEAQLFCRPVTSADEARGVPVDFSGKPMFFPHLSAGKIYLKIFDAGSGSAIFREFRLAEPETAQQAQAVAFAPMSEVEQLRQMVAELQNEVRAMKSPKRKTQEVTADEL